MDNNGQKPTEIGAQLHMQPVPSQGDDDQQQPVVAPPPIPQPPVAKPTADGQLHRQMEPPTKQQISVGGPAERGPVATIEVTDDDEDEQPVAHQEAPVVQVSHPEVVIPQEVKEAGVSESVEAKETQPEDQLQVQIEVPSEEASTTSAATTADANPLNLPMDYEEATKEKKQFKFHEAKKWLAALIKYHWEKFQAQNPTPKPEEGAKIEQ